MKHTRGDHPFRSLWLRWVGANSLAEMLGLGTSFLVFYLVFTLGDPSNLLEASVFALPSILAGGFEGLLVGFGQWWAMHPFLPDIRRRSWILATVIGAMLAWTLGMLPSTLMSVQAAPVSISQTAPAFEPPFWMVILLSMGLGLVAGVILATPQWLVLRRHLSHAGWWVPANCLAWMAAMPLTFIIPDLIPAGASLQTTALILLVALTLVGAIVGAVEGGFLVWMVSRAENEDRLPQPAQM